MQTTSYKADHYEGFTAQVEYQGTAAYPHKTTGYKTPVPPYPAQHRPGRPHHRPALHKLVLSQTPSPYVASSPYKSSLSFSPREEQEEEKNEEKEERIRRYRIY